MAAKARHARAGAGPGGPATVGTARAPARRMRVDSVLVVGAACLVGSVAIGAPRAAAVATTALVAVAARVIPRALRRPVRAWADGAPRRMVSRPVRCGVPGRAGFREHAAPVRRARNDRELAVRHGWGARLPRALRLARLRRTRHRWRARATPRRRAGPRPRRPGGNH